MKLLSTFRHLSHWLLLDAAVRLRTPAVSCGSRRLRSAQHDPAQHNPAQHNPSQHHVMHHATDRARSAQLPGRVRWSAGFRASLLCVSLVLLAAPSLPAAERFFDPALDAVEPGSVERIAEYTSEPRFSSPWVAYVPASDTVPSPTQFLGHLVGAPGELTRSARIVEYVRQIGAASQRVHVETIGVSEEGRDIVLAVIADEAGIGDLDRLKAANAALADPRRTSPAQAEALIDQARPAYYLNCNVHADETGSGEMCMELIYRLAVSEQPMIRAIRENLLVLINPVSEPDGRDKVTDWFYQYLKGKTDFAALPRQSPPYWGRYVFVDINRDAHQKAFAATRAVHRMFFDYHPVVVHDLHEAISLLLSWNGTGPYNPHIDPIVTSRWLEMSFHEMTTMSAMGMPGVWTWNFGEGFGHHYLDSVAINHNAIGRGYETFGNATAETVTRAADADSLTREWYRPWPPPPTFTWSMRDNVNYQQTGALAILDWAARHAGDMLRDFYRTGYNSWRKGVEEKPYAYIIPAAQRDSLRVAQMINRLRDQKIEVATLQADLALNEGRFARGDYIVRMDQPYRNFALDVLEPQRFPEGSEQLPYDDVSWAYPVGFDVSATRIEDERVKTAGTALLTADATATGTVRGQGPVYLLADHGQESLLAARYRLAAYQVEIARAAFRHDSVDYPAGSWIISAPAPAPASGSSMASAGGISNAASTATSTATSTTVHAAPAAPAAPPRTSSGAAHLEREPVADLAATVAALSEELALDLHSARAVPDVARHVAQLPRLGLWIPWADTDMMGWIRYVLDRQRIPYTYLRDEDLRAGGLRDQVDVIVYGPFSRLQLAGQIHGIPPTDGPMPFRASAEFPSLGVPMASDDITGGPGYAGLDALQRFVEAGGVLVTLGTGTTLALEGGLVRGVARADAPEVFTPGAELRVTFDQPDHPIGYGYGRETSVSRTNLPVYDTPRRWLTMAYCTSCLDGPVDTRNVVLSWGGTGGEGGEGGEAGTGGMVVSGGIRGEAQLAGRPAILATPTGAGHIVSYNFNGIHRDMNRGDHRLVWNAIINWNALGGPPE